MSTPHKHAELIKAWADGATIEYLRDPDLRIGCWCTSRNPGWDANTQYRIKPREFPKSSLSDEALDAAVKRVGMQGWLITYHTIADEAVKQYILDMEKDVPTA